MTDNIQSSVKDAISKSLKQMESLGATVEMYDFPYIEEALSTYYVLAPAEASSNLSRFDGVRYGHRDSDAGYLSEMIKNSDNRVWR